MPKVMSVTEVRYLNVSTCPNGECSDELSDYDLSRIAAAKTLKDKKTKRTEMLNKALFLAIPVADIFSSALSPENLTEGIKNTPFSKVFHQLRGRSAFWGKMLAGFGIVKLITSKSEKLSKMEEEHPVAKSVLDIAAVVTGLSATNAIQNKYSEAFISTKKGENAVKTLINNLDNALNESAFARNVYKRFADTVSDFGLKNKNLKAILKASIPHAATAAFALYALHSLVLAPMSIKNRYKENFNNLKNEYDLMNTASSSDLDV